MDPVILPPDATHLALGRVAPMVAGLIGLFLIFVAMGSIGLVEAWKNKRTAFGWVLSYLIAFAGGIAGFLLVICVDIAIAELIIKRDGPPPDAMLAVSFIGAVLMSWGALRMAGRFR